MSTTEKVGSLPDRPMPNGDPATWTYVADLPTPSEVAEEVERYCQKRNWRGWFSRWWKKRLIEAHREHHTCVHYFARKWIVYKRTRRGMLILLVSEPGAPEHHAFCLAIPEAERESIIRWLVPSGNEEDSDWHYYYLWGCNREAQDPPDLPASP